MEAATQTGHKHHVPAEHGDREFLLLKGDVVVERMNLPRDQMCVFCFADRMLEVRPDIDTVAVVAARRAG